MVIEVFVFYLTLSLSLHRRSAFVLPTSNWIFAEFFAAVGDLNSCQMERPNKWDNLYICIKIIRSKFNV